jgi:hypothetical protein
VGTLKVTPPLLAILLAAACAGPPAAPPHPRVDLVTPLPPSFEVRLPAPGLPPAIAGLAGIWKGDWQAAAKAAGDVAVPHTLVVTRIEGAGPSYTAQVIWSWAPGPGGAASGAPGFWDPPGKISGAGELEVTVPGIGRAVYRLSPDGTELTGAFSTAGQTLRGTFHHLPEWGVPLSLLRPPSLAPARQSR